MTTFRFGGRVIAALAVVVIAYGGLARSAARADDGRQHSVEREAGGGKLVDPGGAEGFGARPADRRLREPGGQRRRQGKRSMLAADIVDRGDGRRIEREQGLRQFGAAGIIVALLLAGWLGRERRRLLQSAWAAVLAGPLRLERVVHLAAITSGVLLAVSGFFAFYGRAWLPSLLGQASFDAVARLAMELHGVVAGVFSVALVTAAVIAVRRALPGWVACWRQGLAEPGRNPAGTAALAPAEAACRAVAWSIPVAAGVLAVTGLSLMFPFALRLFVVAHDLMQFFGLASPPGVTLWRDMQLTAAAHVGAGLVLVAASVVRVAFGRAAASPMGEGSRRTEVAATGTATLGHST